jgi:hypothetical protein
VHQRAKVAENQRVNSIRNSKPDSQIHTRVEYKVRKDKVEDVKNNIVKFIDAVRDNEPEEAEKLIIKG